MGIGLNAIVYAPGAAGVPSTTRYADLGGRMVTYEQSISATYGFESLQITCAATKDDALTWLQDGLMCQIVVTGPDAETVWEGYISTVEAQIGQERRTVTLETMANRIRAKYTEVGTPGTTTAVSTSDSIARYGTKDAIISVPGNVAAIYAQSIAQARLGEIAWPPMSLATQVASGALGTTSVTLTATGWYGALDYLIADASTSTLNTSNYVQIQSLLSAYAAVNAFFSTDYADFLTFSAVSPETRSPDMTYKQHIERLFKQGHGTPPNTQRLAYGVYEDRKWRVAVWAGSAPTTITYQRYLGDGHIYGSGGQVIAPWDVRPDAMCQIVDLLDVAPVATTPDAAARFYVERVVCSIRDTTVGVTLEPQKSSSLDARLAFTAKGL